jgi:hypothetical protein
MTIICLFFFLKGWIKHKVKRIWVIKSNQPVMDFNDFRQCVSRSWFSLSVLHNNICHKTVCLFAKADSNKPLTRFSFFDVWPSDGVFREWWHWKCVKETNVVRWWYSLGCLWLWWTLYLKCCPSKKQKKKKKMEKKSAGSRSEPWYYSITDKKCEWKKK